MSRFSPFSPLTQHTARVSSDNWFHGSHFGCLFLSRNNRVAHVKKIYCSVVDKPQFWTPETLGTTYLCVGGDYEHDYNQLCMFGVHFDEIAPAVPFTRVIEVVDSARVVLKGHPVRGTFVGMYVPGATSIHFAADVPPPPEVPSFPRRTDGGWPYILSHLIIDPYIHEICTISMERKRSKHSVEQQLRLVMALRSTCRRYWYHPNLAAATARLFAYATPLVEHQVRRAWNFNTFSYFNRSMAQHYFTKHVVLGNAGSYAETFSKTFTDFPGFVRQLRLHIEICVAADKALPFAFNFMIPVRRHASPHTASFLCGAFVINSEFKARGWYEQKLFAWLNSIAALFQDAGWGFKHHEYVYLARVEAAFTLNAEDKRQFKGTSRVLYRIRILDSLLTSETIPRLNLIKD